MVVSISELRVLLLRGRCNGIERARNLCVSISELRVLLLREKVDQLKALPLSVSISELRVLLLRAESSVLVRLEKRPRFNLRIESLVIERKRGAGGYSRQAQAFQSQN